VLSLLPRKRSAEELLAEAQQASELRALISHPDVVALRVEEIRRFIDRMFGVSVILGLLFTMASVQQFAASGAAFLSLKWWTAWLLDPMFSLALIGVLVAEVVTARQQIKLGFWPEASKWFFLISVLTMNVWASVVGLIPSQIALHAAPVALVFFVAQVAPVVRDKLTESVIRSAEAATRVGETEHPELVAQQIPVFEPLPDPEPVVRSAPVFVSPPLVEEPEPVTEEVSPDETSMSPAEYLLSAWRFGRRVEASELYARYPDKRSASLRAVMSTTRKKNPGLEPPVRPDEEVGNGKRTSKAG
jgi:hypothetical protein